MATTTSKVQSNLPMPDMDATSTTNSVGFEDDDDRTPSVSIISGVNNSNSHSEDSDDAGGEGWEVVPPEVTFGADTVIIEGEDDHDHHHDHVDGMVSPISNRARDTNLKHCQSTPDLRTFSFVGRDDADASIADDSYTVVSRGDFSTNAVFVDAPRVSFRDAILRKGGSDINSPATPSTGSVSSATTPTPKRSRKFRPQIVVTPIRRNSRSMGDLQAAGRNALSIHDEIHEDVLGESDAGLYYMQKQAGAANRKNGRKLRPDESKRLQMTMVKKSLQKQRQGFR